MDRDLNENYISNTKVNTQYDEGLIGEISKNLKDRKDTINIVKSTNHILQSKTRRITNAHISKEVRQKFNNWREYIMVTVADIKNNQIKLGITVPKGVIISREEVFKKIKEENVLSSTSGVFIIS